MIEICKTNNLLEILFFVHRFIAMSINYYHKAKGFWLIQGDCIQVMQHIPNDSIDMIFADPPYMLSNGGLTCQSGKFVSVNKGEWDKSLGPEKDFEFHLKWIEACRRILKPEGTIWISGTYHSIFKCGYALQKSGYKILNDICWFKPNASPNLNCRYFAASHETLIWAIKNPEAKHTFNYDFLKNSEWNGDFLKKTNKQMRSVWAVLTPKAEEKVHGKHPTQKPLDLLKRIILASTKKGDLILDPFTGSSTTGIAAKSTERNFIGIDISKDYLDLSIKRYRDLVQ